MLIFRNDFCVVFLHEIVLSQQFVLAIFAIESNFSDLLSAKALETSLCRMWGSGHYNIGSASLRFEITVCEINWQFGIELCRVLWIDLLEKGRLQLKVTVVKKKNVKKRNQRQQKIWKTRAPGSVTKKRGNKRADHFDGSGRKHLRGFSSTRLNRKCSVPPAGNFLL